MADEQPTLYAEIIGATETARASTRRAGVHAVGSWALTGEQLERIVDALENPPRRADWTGTIVSGGSALFFALKILTGPSFKPEGWDLAAVVIGGCVVVITLWRAGTQHFTKDPHHAKAVRDAKAMAKAETDRHVAA